MQLVQEIKVDRPLTAREALTVARIVRVNHAGEYGAIRIYRAQIAVARHLYPDIADELCEMLDHEIRHCAIFSAAMPARSSRPCRLISLWSTGGALLGFLTATVGCFAFASGLPTPSASEVAWYGSYIVASGMLTCVVGIGLAELVGSRGVAIGVLLGWFLAGEHLVLSVSALGRGRAGLAGVAVDRLRPLYITGDSRELNVSLAAALGVLALWFAVPTVAGAWRAHTRDA